MTAVKDKVLEEILQEHDAAVAHEVAIKHASFSVEQIDFHSRHRDTALRERDRLLAAAGDATRNRFVNLMSQRLIKHDAIKNRLRDIRAEIAVIVQKQDQRRAARNADYRNYRSRWAHVEDAQWVQQKALLEAEAAHCELRLSAEPVLWKAPATT